MIRLSAISASFPIVLVAITALFVLKSLGLVFNGGYTLTDFARNADYGDITGSVPQRVEGSVSAQGNDMAPSAPLPKRPPQKSWAQEMFNFPDVTGSVPTSTPKQEPAPKGKSNAKPAEPPPRRRRERWCRSTVVACSRRPSVPCSNGSPSGAPSSTLALKRWICARAYCGGGEAARKPHRPAQAARSAAQRAGAHQGRGRGGPPQEPHHHV